MPRALLLVAALAAAPALAQDAAPAWAEARAVWLVADTTAPAAPPRPPPLDPWIAQDKALHLGAGFLIALSTQYVFEDKLAHSRAQAWPVSLGSAFVAGLAKEIADARRPRNPFFSWRDLVATTAGGAVAVGVIWL